jgi:hypothetical protein
MRNAKLLRTPAGFSLGTHKKFTRLVICPIYSVVKYRPRETRPSVVSFQLSAKSLELIAVPLTPPQRVWVLLNFEVCKLRKSFQPNVRRQATFVRPRTESRLSQLTPNIRLAFSRQLSAISKISQAEQLTAEC